MLESIMKTFSTFAAAAAIALTVAAPVAAEGPDNSVNPDPFVSSQGVLAGGLLGGMGTAGLVAVGLVVTVVTVAAVDSSGDT